MMDIERFVEKHREEFNHGKMPEGHKERFMQKLESEPRISVAERLKKTIGEAFKTLTLKKAGLYFGIPAVAVVAVCLVIMGINNRGYNRIELVTPADAESAEALENAYLQQIRDYGKSVISFSHSTAPCIEEQISDAVSSISDDAVPMSVQLPQEISRKEQFKILKEYYNQKMLGLHRIKLCLAENKE